MPTNQKRPGRTAGVLVASLALGAALTWLGTVSDAASAVVGGVLAGVVLALQTSRARAVRRTAAQSAYRRADHVTAELRAPRAQDQ
jgi:membrane associated rhomboid family serine protease